MRKSIAATSNARSNPLRRPAFKERSELGGSFETSATNRRQARLWICLAIIAGFIRSADAQQVKFDADNWFAECGALADSDCSIIGVFRNNDAAGPKGSFSLLVDLRNRMVAIVGKPSPSKATVRVDNNQAFECQGTEYCIFSTSDSETIAQQLKSGSLVLVDLVAGENIFRASISTKGYQTDLGKIRAQGFRDRSK
jgi:hypothetical protein